MEKMAIVKQAATRSDIYACIEKAIKSDMDYFTETVSDGMLVHLPDGYFAKVKVTVCNAEKFSLDNVRTKYAEKTQKAAERARKAAERAKEKEEKAVARATAAAEKTV